MTSKLSEDMAEDKSKQRTPVSSISTGYSLRNEATVGRPTASAGKYKNFFMESTSFLNDRSNKQGPTAMGEP